MRDIRWLLPTSGPKSLAALRVAAGFACLWLVKALFRLELPPERLWVPPVGTKWLLFLPVNQGLFEASLALAGVAGVAVLLGYRPRFFAALSAAALFYGGWVPTLTGKVDHFHHVLWVMVLLSVSPCANAWAVRKETRSGSFALPVFAMMVILGLIYFGAGLQKIGSVGLEWAWSNNMSNMMQQFAWKKGLTIPSFFLAETPSRLLGAAGLAFEILFLPLVLHPVTRKYVWPTGVLFHVSVWFLLGISFLHLLVLYVVFVPWDAAEYQPPARGQRSVIVALVVLIAIFSVSGVDRAWPLAAYPGFEGIRSAQIKDYEVLMGDERSFVTSGSVLGSWSDDRILTFIRLNLRKGNEEPLAAWLGVDEITAVVLEVGSGEELSRDTVFP